MHVAAGLDLVNLQFRSARVDGHGARRRFQRVLIQFRPPRCNPIAARASREESEATHH